MNYEKIDVVEQAFDGAWAVIQANEPNRNLKYDCERMAALRQKIGELVVDGSLLSLGRFGKRRGDLGTILGATCENWRRGLFRSDRIR
jgi:hypothetical protein